MSLAGSSLSSDSKRDLSYGKTYVVEPKGKHQATIVMLHGLGDIGYSWELTMSKLALPNIKWICPTAPERPLTLFGRFRSNSWFDVIEFSDDGKDDLEGLDATAAYVASLLATEPPDIKLGVGGFNYGTTAALYSATCFVHGKYHNGEPYPINLSAVLGLSGFLPCGSTLVQKIDGVEDAANRAASLPIMLCHGKEDDVIPHRFAVKSSKRLILAGFQDVTFKSYSPLRHQTLPLVMDDVCLWLTTKLCLDG